GRLLSPSHHHHHHAASSLLDAVATVAVAAVCHCFCGRHPRCSILLPRIRLQRNSPRSFALVFVESNLRPSHRADVTPAPILRPASIARNPGLKSDANRENS
ncbi:hypothetical protein R3P38DRAFT_3282361, partial [Favolaschia claudopus]